MSDKFVKFPSIEKFSDVNAYIKRRYEVEQRPTINYRGKIKLHGSNASVRRDPDGTIYPGKRTSLVDVQNDNAGFANYVSRLNHETAFKNQDVPYVIFGEWAGPGVQKKVAVSLIPEKTFFVFSVYLPTADVWYIEPEDIIKIIGDYFVILPWETKEFTVDTRLTSSMESFLREVGGLVDQCDKVDPYIKDVFGIEGVGEGFVFYPTNMHEHNITNYMFKAKGESHAGVQGDKVRIEIDPAVLAGAEAFATQFVTEARCRQGLTEACGGEASTKNIGPFMAWLGADVKKESANELEASGLEWKQVSKAVNQRARDWFILEIEKVL